MSAKEMFKKLGYKKVNVYLPYEKYICYKINLLNKYATNHFIVFDLISKTFKKEQTEDWAIGITLEEFKAIQKQIKELHWND